MEKRLLYLEGHTDSTFSSMKKKLENVNNVNAALESVKEKLDTQQKSFRADKVK